MLTGRFRFRKTWLGRCILEVQERTRTYCAGEPAGLPANIWRDATPDEAHDFMIKMGGCFK